jgi:hypothetical protein
MRIVIHELKVLESEREQVGHHGIDFHLRERPGFTSELQRGLFEMIVVQVGVPQSVDKVAGGELCDLSHHHRQQRVRCDIKRHAEKDVGASLIKLTGKFALGHIELKQQVARRERHSRHVGRVPGAHNQPARIRIRADGFDDFADLIDALARRCGPRPPLFAINRAKLAFVISPFIPDGNMILVEILNVRLTAQKPQQLVNNRSQVKLFRRHERKPIGQVEPHLIAENTACAGAGAVALGNAVIEDVLQQVEILLHVTRLFLRHQFFNDFGHERWVIFLAQVLNTIGRNAALLERRDHLVPFRLPAFTFGEIKIGYEFTQSLKRNGIAIVVIVFDDFLLILGIFFTHGLHPRCRIM